MLCVIFLFSLANSFIISNRKCNTYNPVFSNSSNSLISTTKLPNATDKDWEWKADHLNMFGPWNMFLPRMISEIPLITSNNQINPSMFFFDPSGRVSSSESCSANSGFYLLDSSSDDLIQGRRFACVLSCGFRYHNLKLVFLGRVFFSKNYVVNELSNLIKLKSGLFIGHLFIEQYDSDEKREVLHRLRERISLIDIHYNEIDPQNWNFVSMDGIGNPLRNLYGNDVWRWLGPVVGYRMLQDVKNNYFDKQTHMFHSNFANDIYNYFDPQVMDIPQISSVDMYMENIFSKAFINKCSIDEPENKEILIKEMCDLAREGPNFYKKKFT